jgi:hypothetical protein
VGLSKAEMVAGMLDGVVKNEHRGSSKNDSGAVAFQELNERGAL